MRVSAGNRWRCIVKYQAGVSADNRAVIGSATYNIESAVDMGGRGVWLELTISEGAS
jgi:head-tail adaptor